MEYKQWQTKILKKNAIGNLNCYTLYINSILNFVKIMQFTCRSACPLLNINDKVSYLKLQKAFDIKESSLSNPNCKENQDFFIHSSDNDT